MHCRTCSERLRDDVLDVFVWKDKQLSGRITVDSDGTVTLPLIGQVKAAGLTTKELQTDLTAAEKIDRLRDFFARFGPLAPVVYFLLVVAEVVIALPSRIAR